MFCIHARTVIIIASDVNFVQLPVLLYSVLPVRVWSSLHPVLHFCTISRDCILCHNCILCHFHCYCKQDLYSDTDATAAVVVMAAVPMVIVLQEWSPYRTFCVKYSATVVTISHFLFKYSAVVVAISQSLW